MAKHIIAGGAIAEWSDVNQAWVIRPHNPSWPKEVCDNAPILGVLTSEHAVINFLVERRYIRS